MLHIFFFLSLFLFLLASTEKRNSTWSRLRERKTWKKKEERRRKEIHTSLAHRVTTAAWEDPSLINYLAWGLRKSVEIPIFERVQHCSRRRVVSSSCEDTFSSTSLSPLLAFLSSSFLRILEKENEDSTHYFFFIIIMWDREIGRSFLFLPRSFLSLSLIFSFVVTFICNCVYIYFFFSFIPCSFSLSLSFFFFNRPPSQWNVLRGKLFSGNASTAFSADFQWIRGPLAFRVIHRWKDKIKTKRKSEKKLKGRERGFARFEKRVVRQKRKLRSILLFPLSAHCV